MAKLTNSEFLANLLAINPTKAHSLLDLATSLYGMADKGQMARARQAIDKAIGQGKATRIVVDGPAGGIYYAGKVAK